MDHAKVAMRLGQSRIHNPYLLRQPLCHTPASHVRLVMRLFEILSTIQKCVCGTMLPVLRHLLTAASSRKINPTTIPFAAFHPPPPPPPTTYHVSPTAHVWGTIFPVLCPPASSCMHPCSTVTSNRGIHAVTCRGGGVSSHTEAIFCVKQQNTVKPRVVWTATPEPRVQIMMACGVDRGVRHAVCCQVSKWICASCILTQGPLPYTQHGNTRPS
jgi:hypothetical protein